MVFQPHLYSRTRDFAAEFAAALALADVVVVMDVYAAREDPMPGVSVALVADALRALRRTPTSPWSRRGRPWPARGRRWPARATSSSPWAPGT